MKKHDNGEPNRKNARFGCAFLLSPFLLIVVFLVLTHFCNNFRLWQLERRFAGLFHPASSKFVRREKFK